MSTPPTTGLAPVSLRRIALSLSKEGYTGTISQVEVACPPLHQDTPCITTGWRLIWWPVIPDLLLQSGELLVVDGEARTILSTSTLDGDIAAERTATAPNGS